MGPYAGGYYYLTLCPLQESTPTHGQTMPKSTLTLKKKPEFDFIPPSGTLDLASYRFESKDPQKSIKGRHTPTMQRKSHLCIPFLGARQFPHSCVCEQFIYFSRIAPDISCSRIGRSITGIYVQ